MFPGAGAQVYYNEAGEPLGWDYPAAEDYDPADCDDFGCHDPDPCKGAGEWLPSEDGDYCVRCGCPESMHEECEHESVDVKAGPPDPTGRCRTYRVCEDCGEELGEEGWDAVL